MCILYCPNRSVASTFPHIAQMLLLLVVKTELSEVGACAQISKYNLFRLKGFIVTNWELGVAYL